MLMSRAREPNLAVMPMPDFRTHVYWGIATYPVFIFLSLTAIELLHVCPLQDSRLIGYGYLLFVLGSDVPDIDSKSALIKRIFEVLIAGLFACVFYSSVISPEIQPFVLSWLNSMSLAVAISFSLAIALGVVVSKAINLLSHRGFFHSVWGGLLYGLIIVTTVLLRSELLGGEMNYTEVLFLGVAGSVGYYLHLILDRVHGFAKGWRVPAAQNEKDGV
ncbi:MAG: hydrolase [Thermotogaceae bacterium]|nr:hydrolase [Thermotogaceae bacterium]